MRGGDSPERHISLRSGRAVTRALRRVGIKVIPLDPAKPSAFRQKIHKVEMLFIALHGAGGEDGVLQKRLEHQKICFTGSSSVACRKSFNKFISKQYFERLGVPTPPYEILHLKNWKRMASGFPVPYFVKPLEGGSSQGVFLVEDFQKSAEKIEQAIKHFRVLLIEKRIEGRELTAGLLANRKLPIVEVRPSRPFYDFKAKYTAGMTTYEVPAKVPPKVTKRIQAIAWRVYRGMGLSGFSRVDVMLDKKNRPFVLEVNSIPGLTEFSLLPKAARAVGISFEELCLIVLKDAVVRFTEKKK